MYSTCPVPGCKQRALAICVVLVIIIDVSACTPPAGSEEHTDLSTLVI